MTQEMPYTVTATRSDYEIRHYPPAMLAQVRVTGSASQAGNIGFGPLVSFISGNNTSQQRIAMTSPVLQNAMRENEHLVSFVMPEGIEPATVPVPRDSRVTMVETPAREMAAVTYRGRWTDARFQAHANELLAALRRDGIAVIGTPEWARYDPPWTPAFLRRNEVLVEISRDA